MTDKLRAAAERVLEILLFDKHEVRILGAINVLREALAEPAEQLSRSQALRDAGFTQRDTRLTCGECGKKFSLQMLPVHKCEAEQAQPLPEQKSGQARTMTITTGDPTERGHWYSLDAVRALLAQAVAPKRIDWQQRALNVGFDYVRGPDDHYVTGTQEQAIELLRDVLGVDVFIEAQQAEPPDRSEQMRQAREADDAIWQELLAERNELLAALKMREPLSNGLVEATGRVLADAMGTYSGSRETPDYAVEVAVWLKELSDQGIGGKIMSDTIEELADRRVFLAVEYADDYEWFLKQELPVRQQLAKSVQALRTRLEAAEKDAARYSFWRKYYNSTFAIAGRHILSFKPSRPQVEIAGPDYEQVVDAAIDAAMTTEPT